MSSKELVCSNCGGHFTQNLDHHKVMVEWQQVFVLSAGKALEGSQNLKAIWAPILQKNCPALGHISKILPSPTTRKSLLKKTHTLLLTEENAQTVTPPLPIKEISPEKSIIPSPICGKSCTRPSDLSKHKKIHAKEPPYACSACEKCFRTKSGQRKHKQMHTGQQASLMRWVWKMIHRQCRPCHLQEDPHRWETEPVHQQLCAYPTSEDPPGCPATFLHWVQGMLRLSISANQTPSNPHRGTTTCLFWVQKMFPIPQRPGKAPYNSHWAQPAHTSLSIRGSTRERGPILVWSEGSPLWASLPSPNTIKRIPKTNAKAVWNAENCSPKIILFKY